MRVTLLRHGRTAYNDQGRYQGQLDIPLSPEGAAELAPSPDAPERVYVSPLRRARETARLVYPGAAQVVVPDFAEMDFGAFDGRTAREMAGDSAYRAWVEGGCAAQCPGGESREGFCRRTRAAFARLLEDRGEELIAIVAHGGTLRAVMEGFALPERGYFDWTAPNGGGFELAWDPSLWQSRRRLRCTGRLFPAGKP